MISYATVGDVSPICQGQSLGGGEQVEVEPISTQGSWEMSTLEE